MRVSAMTPGCSTICSDPSRCFFFFFFFPASNVSLQQFQALRAHAKCPTLPGLPLTHSVKAHHKATWTNTGTEGHISPGAQIHNLVEHLKYYKV